MPRARFKLHAGHRELRTAIGKRLRELRHDTGYTLAKIEKLTGVSRSTLGYVERGESFIRLPELTTLAAFYDVTPSYLIEGGTLRRKLKTPLETVAGQVAAGH